jgi:hypothetical protein
MLRGFSTISLSMKNNARLNSVQAGACLNNIKFRNEIHLVVRRSKSATRTKKQRVTSVSMHKLTVLNRFSKSINRAIQRDA